ncbi:MAG TPA: TonB-dependent receptor, partial [Gemmatimonadales bacterium]|nr:TonB-dependent receptor [Gemmatimonadales bacterium]
MRTTRVAVFTLFLAPGLLGAQQQPARRDSVVELPPMTVTATRDLREVFRTPAPVSVVDSTALAQRLPSNLTDLFVDLPGLDVNGVGPSQSRPIIRGLMGQRILLLEDGIRMNNSRRQQDFGEIPSLVALEELGRVEVVRGPASVLYGTDAIGGAVNLITKEPPQTLVGTEVHGALGYRYEGAGSQQRPWGVFTGNVGRFNWLAFGAYRDAGPYESPAGSFGGATLPRLTRVQDTGIRDENLALQAGYMLAPQQSVYARFERYHADTAGFGYVQNADVQPFDPNAPTIRITYPDQSVNKLTLGYGAKGLGFGLADRLDVTGYYIRNDRLLNLDVTIPLGPGASGVSSTRNFTNLDTWGFRVEAAKAIAGRHLLTYGLDGFHDNSVNGDTLTLTGFGPPMTSTTPQIPDATFRSLGAFAQGDLHLVPRLSLIAGVRVQDIRAATRPTAGITAPPVAHENQTVVGTLNTGFDVSDHFTLVATVGRGFRSPDLVERFFTGPTPEGNGYQRQTPNLRPETSLNVDLGFRYRNGPVSLEAFAFRNEIHDGIGIQATGDTVQGLPEYQNVNVDR